MSINLLVSAAAALLKERVGGPAGSDDPAGVMIDFFVIDVKGEGIGRPVSL